MPSAGLPIGLAQPNRRSHHHERAPGAGYGPADQKQIALGVGLDDLEVERGHPAMAHVSGHPGPLENTTRCSAGADRTRRAVLRLRTVCRGLSLEVVSLHAAGEALALGHADHVDALAGLEHIGLD